MSLRKLTGALAASLLIPMFVSACAGSLQKAELDLPGPAGQQGPDKKVFAVFNAPGVVAPSATVATSFSCLYQQRCLEDGKPAIIPGASGLQQIGPGVFFALGQYLWCSNCPATNYNSNNTNSGNTKIDTTANGGKGGAGGGGGTAQIAPNAVTNNIAGSTAQIAPGSVVNNNRVQGGDSRIESGAVVNRVEGGNARIESGAVVNNVEGSRIDPNAVVNTITTGDTSVVNDARSGDVIVDANSSSIANPVANGGGVAPNAIVVNASPTAIASPTIENVATASPVTNVENEVRADGGDGGQINGDGLFHLNLAQTLNQGPTTLNGGPTSFNVGPIEVSASGGNGYADATAASQSDANAAAQAAAAAQADAQNANNITLPVVQPSGDGTGGEYGGGHGGDRDRDHD